MSKLQEIRLSRNLSQSQLAKKSGVSIKTIQAYEQKIRNINYGYFIIGLKLARALKCRPEELLEVENETPIINKE